MFLLSFIWFFLYATPSGFKFWVKKGIFFMSLKALSSHPLYIYRKFLKKNSPTPLSNKGNTKKPHLLNSLQQSYVWMSCGLKSQDSLKSQEISDDFFLVFNSSKKIPISALVSKRWVNQKKILAHDYTDLTYLT